MSTPSVPRVGAVASTLAIHGGRPVRTRPLPGPYPGALLIGEDEEREVLDVLRARSLFRYYGPSPLGKTAAFERVLARRLGVRHALGVSSGTAALRCALVAVGVGRGDEVLVPAYSYVATVDVVLSIGAVPIFVDVDDTLTMDPEDLVRKISPRARAVTPVHLFGVAADMDPILAIARRHGLRVVEDFAQSLGATYRGRYAGTLGDAGITSFQLNKIITAGEGGAVVTDDEELMAKAVRHHDHGNYRDNEALGDPSPGDGLRMSELNAAVLLAQIRRVDEILGRLRAAKACITDALAQVPGVELRRSTDPAGDAGCAVIFFVRDATRCAAIVEAIAREGIPVVRQYGGRPVYAHPAVRAAVAGAAPCARCADLAARAVFFGLTTTLSAQDLADVVEGITKVLRVLA